MGQKYKAVLPKIKELSVLGTVQSLLNWDQEVMMPKGGADGRSEQQATMTAIGHEKLTDPKLGEMLEAASAETDLNPYEQTNVRETLRAHKKALKIPSELITELSRTSSKSVHVWKEARQKSDFPMLAPWLEKIIKISREIAEHVGYAKVPYDALLDEYDQGATLENTAKVLMPVRDALVPIISALSKAPKKPDRSILTRTYPAAVQEKICRELVQQIGYKMDHGRLDVSTHPFCSTVAPGDTRLTTRFYENWLPSSLFGAIHEAGHGIYEQGVNPDYECTPAADAAWLSIHESQSRFWENFVGRSRPFWQHNFPKLKSAFPDVLADVDLDAFYGAANTVLPSLIRVEADEVTYGLHVILRFEIEQGLFDGSLTTKDLPGIWNEKMTKYLGVTPKNDAEGVLQDIHWPGGALGYFPTYLMGTLYSAQWDHYIRKDLPMDELIAKGDCLPIRNWLNQKVHSEGRRFRARDLVKHVTGEDLNPNYFVQYLKSKFGPIYGITL